MLQLTAVHKRYDGTSDAEAVLRGIDLTVGEGESLAIVGPSGSGKSTLLNILGTLDRPTQGAYRFEGQDVIALSDLQLAAMRNRKIGFIFQLHHLLPHCSALENVLVPAIVHPERRDVAKRATALLERVGLGSRLHYRPGQLSGGERQRVAVVRALINRPLLVLADEPTGSLDETGAFALCDLLLELNRHERTTLIMVTHNRAIASRMARVTELRDGHLAELARE